MKFSLFGLPLMAIVASTLEIVPAKRMAKPLNTRSSFYGGWPIAATSCPANTTSCNDGQCCPSTTQCYTEGLGGQAVCCPDTNNCIDTVNTLPICADPSWTLYIGNYYYFCCAVGQVGILPDKASSTAPGLCVDSSVSPPASVRATLYSAAISATSTSTSSSAASTSASPTISNSSSSPSVEGTSQSSSSSTSATSGPTPTSSSTTKPTVVTVNGSSKSGSNSMTDSATSSVSTTQVATPTPDSQTTVSHTGPIAGGVVGGVVGLILLAIVIWYFGIHRRKEKVRMAVASSNPAGPVTEKGSATRNELPGEMAGNSGVSEMAAINEAAARKGNFDSGRMSPAEMA